MNTQSIVKRPVELNFRHCVIKRNYNNNRKYVSVEGIPGVAHPELTFDAEYYDVGENFYAYLVPNMLYSGIEEDETFTLININSFKPFLIGTAGPGASLIKCGSGGSKPPKGSGTSSGKLNQNKIFEEMKSALINAKKYNNSLKKINITVNDFGLPMVVFSRNKINKWDRIESIPLRFPSSYGITYSIKNRVNKDFLWICD